MGNLYKPMDIIEDRDDYERNRKNGKWSRKNNEK